MVAGSTILARRDYPVELNLHPNFMAIGTKNSVMPEDPRVRIHKKAERMADVLKKHFTSVVTKQKQQNFTQFLISGQSLPPSEISKLDPLQKALYLNRMLMLEHEA
mmetsp:Transcript_19421/g.29841  ORF Transcript_19421/g.29841 Transcript_19421/m.29841 type:complete len:106 (-) Transcript_19421:227-544(-)